MGQRCCPAQKADIPPLACLDELRLRLEDPAAAHPARFLVVAGLGRWRGLRGATWCDTSPASAGLRSLLDEGPDVGLHAIVWTDGHGALERSLGRGAAALFDLRAVLRVPESDAQNLLESAAAARLADNRALFRHEEWTGRTEAFKPYPVPAGEALAGRLRDWT